MSKEISLSRAATVLVDDADYARLKSHDWFLSGTGYAVAFIPRDGRFALTYMHRFLLDAPADKLVDHINGNSLDNRRENLRLATSCQNHQNRALCRHSHTGYKGVGWHKRRQKYHARIQLQGVRYHLGFFEKAEDAALAYDAAARWLFGDFASCNFTDTQTPVAIETQVRTRLQRRGVKVGRNGSGASGPDQIGIQPTRDGSV